MKDILLINNKAKSTGIGTYSYNLYDNLTKITSRNIDFITLSSAFADSNGSTVKAFPRDIKKLLDHLGFVAQDSQLVQGVSSS